MTPIRRRILAAALAVGTAVALSACSTAAPAPSDNSSDSGEPDKVSFGIFAGPAIASFQIGIEQGFFEDQGIELTIEQAASGAAHLPALTTGSLQFLLTSPITPMLAASQGVDIKIVSNYTANDPDEVADSTVLAVAAGSTLTRAKDLEGKTVAINAPGGIGELAVKYLVAQDGGDPSKVNLVTLSLSEAADQLLAGQIDAGMTGTPYLNALIAEGGSVFLDFIQETGVGGSELVIAANGGVVKNDPDLVKRFVAALDATQQYLLANDDELRAKIVEMLNIPEPVVASMIFGNSTTVLDMDALNAIAEVMLETGTVSTLPDVDAIVAKLD